MQIQQQNEKVAEGWDRSAAKRILRVEVEVAILPICHSLYRYD